MYEYRCPIMYMYCSSMNVLLYNITEACTVKLRCDCHSIWSEHCGSYHGYATMFTPNGVTVTP